VSRPDDPFEGMGLFADLARMLGQQGAGAPWAGAMQLAVGIATDGQSEANVDPVERMRIEALARVAELHVTDLTGLATSVAGRSVTVLPVNRTRWVQESLEAYRPLIERLTDALGAAAGPMPGPDDLPEELAGSDQLAGMLEGMMRMFRPMMVSMTAGSMVGHLARRSLGQYDLPIPRPPSDELLLVVPNLDQLAQEWSLPPDDLRLWVCVHEIAHHAVLGVPHVRARIESLMAEYSTGFRSDPGALEERFSSLDIGDPGSLGGLQELFGDPEALLGAIRSPEQEALLPRIEAVVAVVVGMVDHVLDVVGAKLMPGHSRLTEALRRRRVEADASDRFVERLLGLELSQDVYDRGASFVDGVVERAGEDGLRQLWAAERYLPTPAEIDAPGLWLARIEFE
jgi:putative hydrolase